MEPSFTIRLALPADAERIFSILSEVACQIPIDLSTPQHVEELKAQIDDWCCSGFSYVAVDENDDLVGVQLAKRARWVDDEYIHLTYAGVTAAARGKKVFRRLIEAEKGHGRRLVAAVKPNNKSDTVAKLQRYGFQSWPWSEPPSPFDFAYRWDPEVTSGC
jgi:hypothetical protein